MYPQREFFEEVEVATTIAQDIAEGVDPLTMAMDVIVAEEVGSIMDDLTGF